MWRTLIHFAWGPESDPFIVHWRSGNIMKITRQQWQCLVVTLVTTWLSPEIGSSPGIGRGCLVSAGRGGCSGRKQFHFLHPATGSRTQITCCRSPHTWAVVVWDEVINTQWYTCIGAEGSFHFPSYSQIDLSPFYVSLKLYIVSLVIKKQRDPHRPSLDWWTQVMTSRVEWS